MWRVCTICTFFPHPYSSSFPWQPDAFVDITIIYYETIIITHVGIWDVPIHYVYVYCTVTL